MDLVALFEDSAWVENTLRGHAIDDMAEGRITAPVPLNDEHLLTLRRCWVVLEVLHRLDGARWPAWPRDLQPVAIEVFSLAAFAVTDAARPGLSIVQYAWTNLELDVDAFLQDRFERTPPSFMPPFLRTLMVSINRLSVPESCAALLQGQIPQLSELTRNSCWLDPELFWVLNNSSGYRDRCMFARTRLCALASDGHTLSFAAAMLLVAYIAAIIPQVKRDALRYAAFTDLMDTTRTVFWELQDRYNNIRGVREAPAYLVHAALVALSDEFWRPQRAVAFGMGSHGRLGENSMVKGLDGLAMQLIHDHMWQFGYGQRRVLFT